MMYKNNLAATIKVKGKVLREFGDTVYLPFGSEYSIYVKNMNSVRASVKVSIDGKDVLGGSSLVVSPNDSIDLERFLEDNNRGHKFKFIERTSSIENHRGVGAEDGLVRIEFTYEKKIPYFVGTNRNYYEDTWRSASLRDMYCSTLLPCDTIKSLNAMGSPQCQVGSQSLRSFNDTGITAKGEISEQKFQTVSAFTTEAESTVIVLQLKGENQGSVIKEEVHVKRQSTCDCCGRKNKATAKFCAECGNSLEVIS